MELGDSLSSRVECPVAILPHAHDVVSGRSCRRAFDISQSRLNLFGRRITSIDAAIKSLDTFARSFLLTGTNQVSGLSQKERRIHRKQGLLRNGRLRTLRR